VKRIGLVLNPHRLNAPSVARELIEWLLKKGCQIWVEEKLANALGKSNLGSPSDELADRIELLIVLGGDGTLLYGTHLVWKKDIPILGINLGSLGFLTEVTQEELYPVLGPILEDKIEYEERMLVKAEVIRKGSPIQSFRGLNEVAITMGPIARVITLEISIEGEYLGAYAADGVVVATPTGSTAYSLSAGGPILNPAMEALVLTPICPHTLAIRPIVLPNTHSIEIVVKESPQGAVLTVDGQEGFPLAESDRILLAKAERSIRIIKSPRGFYGLVRTKLRWGGLPEREG